MYPAIEHFLKREDQRSSRRFPIEVDLSYLVLRGEAVDSTGHGRTINISSGGILFESVRSLRPGSHIELSIAWPARIDGIVQMQLQASGRTVRQQDNTTAVQILHHEFRTKGIRQWGKRETAIAVSA